jgi:hypothetical protein
MILEFKTGKVLKNHANGVNIGVKWRVSIIVKATTEGFSESAELDMVFNTNEYFIIF